MALPQSSPIAQRPRGAAGGEVPGEPLVVPQWSSPLLRCRGGAGGGSAPEAPFLALRRRSPWCRRPGGVLGVTTPEERVLAPLQRTALCHPSRAVVSRERRRSSLFDAQLFLEPLCCIGGAVGGATLVSR